MNGGQSISTRLGQQTGQTESVPAAGASDLTAESITGKPPGFWALVREDWQTNRRDWTSPGFRALFMYRFGVWRMTLRPRLVRMPFSFLYKLMHRFIRNYHGVEIHDKTRIGRRLLIAHQGGIVIHDHSVIGDDCIVRQGVTLGRASRFRADDAPILGNRVDVGAGAVLVGGIKIGDDARIGPNAVVMQDVPAGAIATAPPARIVLAPGTSAKSG